MTQDPLRIKLTERIETLPIRVLGRTHLACVRCRTQKTKCDGEKPSCKTCLLSNKDCFYEFKDRKIILYESHLNKLQDRIKYLEQNLTNLTLNSDINIIDLSKDDENENFISPQPIQPKPQKVKQNLPFVKLEDEDKINLSDPLFNNNLLPTGFIHQSYASVPNPLFVTEEFTQDYSVPPEREKRTIDQIFIESKNINLEQSLESSNRNLLQFDFALQNYLGEFAYFDSVNTPVSNFHQDARHYLSDRYFDFPFSGYITLPDKEYTLELFHIVYERLCQNYYFYDKKSFLEQVDKVYEDMSAQTSSFLCKLLVTLALGEQYVFSKLSFHPDFTLKYGDKINAGVPGLKFFTLAIQLFRYNHENFSISDIQSCVLLLQYEQILNRTTLLYAFYGLAMRLLILKGYHRKLKNDTSSPELRERKKRIWWSVYCVTILCCAKMHLPLEINYSETDIELPLENFVDLHDGFKVDLLDAEVKVLRYLNSIIRNIFSANSRNFNESCIKDKDKRHTLQDKIDSTIQLISQYETVRLEIAPIFQRLEDDFVNGTVMTSRDDLNLAMTYHCAILFLTRPVLLSFFRGLVKETEQTRKIVKTSIESLYKMITILQFLKDCFLIHTFDYWDNQRCFSALLVLTVAGMAGIKSKLYGTGVELMAFMANSGNHTARSFFTKLIRLQEYLTASGCKPIYDKPLISLTTYPKIENNISNEQASCLNKVLVKQSDITVDEVRMNPRSSTKRHRSNSFAMTNLTRPQQDQFVPEPPVLSQFPYNGKEANSSSNFSLLSPTQPQKTLQQLHQQHSSSGSTLSRTVSASTASSFSSLSIKSSKAVPPLPDLPISTLALDNPIFENDLEFFESLVSGIQVWDNPFSSDFVNQRNEQSQQLGAQDQPQQEDPQSSTTPKLEQGLPSTTEFPPLNPILESVQSPNYHHLNSQQLPPSLMMPQATTATTITNSTLSALPLTPPFGISMGGGNGITIPATGLIPVTDNQHGLESVTEFHGEMGM